MLQLEDIRFAYSSGGFELAFTTFGVSAGSSAALTGASGSGKSTLLHLAGGILVAEKGRVTVDGVAISAMRESERRRFRVQHIGLVFQAFELLPHLTALENMELPLRLARRPSDRHALVEIAVSLGIDDVLSRHPSTLSHGQRQRIAIGRALATRPRLLLADEPTGNLDPAAKRVVVELLLAQCRERNIALLMATHDVELVPRFDTVIEMKTLSREAMR